MSAGGLQRRPGWDAGKFTDAKPMSAFRYYVDRAAPSPQYLPPFPRLGGSRMLRGLMVRMKKIFLAFSMFSKYLSRYSCIMKFNGTVVTYLIFEFLIPACYFHVYMCIVHTVYEKCTVIFSWILNMGPHSCIGVARQIQLWGPLGGSQGPVWGRLRGGSSNSLAPALYVKCRFCYVASFSVLVTPG